MIDWRKRQVMDTPAQVFLNVTDIQDESEMAPWLHEGTAPGQIITGDTDDGCNRRLNWLIQQALPGSDLVILPHLNQAIFIEATDQVLPHVRDFLLKQV